MAVVLNDEDRLLRGSRRGMLVTPSGVQGLQDVAVEELADPMAMSSGLTAGAVRITETRAGRYQVQVEARGTRFLADEPVASGGLGSGPNPYDLLGAALGSCTAMTLRLYANRKAWPLARVTVAVVHTRDAAAARRVRTRHRPRRRA